MRPSSSQEGFVLYFVIIISSILLTITVGSSMIVTLQLKIAGNVENSLGALSAADAGAEKAFSLVLDHLRDRTAIPPDTIQGELEISSRFEARVRCSPDSGLPTVCDNIRDAECEAENFCIYSTGIFQGARRAVELRF